jgi:uncharacterized protein (DUF1697 family)
VPRYVALLRAINVGGHIVKMDRLRTLFEELGFKNVKTFIASGNVLFDSPSKSPTALEAKIEKHLGKSLGYAVDTFVRTPAELAAVVAAKPFAGSTLHSAKNSLYVGFLKAAPPEEVGSRLAALTTDDDEFRVHGREFYWSCRTSMGQSTVNTVALNRALPGSTTVRSVTTVRRLAELE